MSEFQNLIGNLSPEKRALLERRLMEKRAAAAKAQIIPRRTTNGPCPLSFAQELMWLLDHLIDTSAYHVPRALRIRGPLNVEALEYALNRIVARHDILRTTYREVDGRPLQFIADSAALALEHVDLRGLEPQEREKSAIDMLVEEGRHKFDLANDRMLRALLLRMGQQDHILLLLSHHIASDGQSKAALFRELKAFYVAYCSNMTAQLPELPIQYADFATWQREWMQGEVLQKHLEYWKSQLAGAPTLLELPTDRPRPARQSFEGARQFLRCPDDMLESFQALSRTEGSTLFMTMLAAFGTLLYRWSGNEDMLIGTPVSGRNRTELEPLIGYFSNSVVLRLALHGDPTFRELMRRVKDLSLAAYSHQDLPFEKLVVELQPDRDLSYSPMYQVMFSVGEQKDLGLDLPGLEITPIIIDRKIAKFDMTLGMTEFHNDLMCNIEYCSALFEASTMERLANYFQNLLQGIMRNPEQRISALPMLSDAQRREMIFQWNSTYRDYPSNVFVHDLVEQHASQTPDATAVVYEDKQLTYRQLNERSNQLARYLKRRGVGPEIRVAICMERSLDMIVGVLAIMKAGGAYVPLDAMYARERLLIILQDAECPMLLTHNNLRQTITPTAAEIIALDSDWGTISEESKDNLQHEITPETLAYVVYTSGSTGIPKGVMINHGSLINQYYAYRESYDLSRPGESWLYMANFSFDVFSSDLTRSLCSGGKMVICPMELLLDPAGLYDLMLRETVECAEFVPAVLRALTGYLQDTNKKLDFMRLLICSSDAWTMAEYRAVLALRGPQTRVINAYGVTEATIDSTYFEPEHPESIQGNGFVPIGRPFANTQAYVLDQHMEPSPIGCPGVLYLGGAGVARGYLKRPELNAERFVPDPFTDRAHARLYNTGDAARYRPDGNIEFLGRTDNQVKIRGFRIELGEVEATIAKYNGVQQAVVIARELSPGQLGLVAYVVPASGTTFDIAGLRVFLKGKLPAYMLPSAVELIDKIPLTANRKLDRKALPAPQQKSADLVQHFVPTSTDTEKKLESIWSEVLHLSPIGTLDNFFALGGHSLMAIQVISRIRKLFGVELPLRALFENPTIAELAPVVESGLNTPMSVEVPLVPVNREAFRVKRNRS
ncbi:MAG TPA: amino acid adenylation domain-containing protein [Terriglobales bacterium]|nr:amino acid adenylation domain-containing protein [Terriglobales bacterium]